MARRNRDDHRGVSRSAQNLTQLERRLSSSVQKVDGCLAVLTVYEVDEEGARSFDSLAGEPRTFKTWLEQGLSAARILSTAP